MSTEEILRKIHQVERIKEIQDIGSEPWMLVYSYQYEKDQANGGYSSGLLSRAFISDVMSKDSWDSVGHDAPGFSQSYPKGEAPVTTYHRFGHEDRGEPLIIHRSFHSLRPQYTELLEEFRLFHNLYHDRINDKYIRFDDRGEEEVVAELSPKLARVRTRQLRQFMAARGLHLAIYFDFVVFANIDLKAIPEESRFQEVITDDLRYSLHIGNEGGRSCSRLLGKKLITPPPVEQCGIWPFEEEDERYAEFLIGTDAQGRDVRHSCNPEKLDNYFGKNPGAPNFLTPISFRPEVLKKYYDNPEKYSVEDGYVRCGGLWGLNIDNQQPEKVTVFLGYLGQSLAYDEQIYWQSFNLPAEGGLSETAFRRSFLAEFADPTAEDLVFKSKFIEFNEAWEKRFGWPLMRPLHDEDAHVFARLHIPLTKSLSEFEDQILGIAKLLIDSLNDAELARELGGSLKEEKSIAKFERFLASKNYPHSTRDISIFRLLQEVRSRWVAHRKGSDNSEIEKKLGLDTKDAPTVFRGLLAQTTEIMASLSAHFLAEPHNEITDVEES